MVYLIFQFCVIFSVSFVAGLSVILTSGDIVFINSYGMEEEMFELTLVPVAEINNEMSSFSLNSPTSVKTIINNDIAYAFILENEKNAINIINITDPESPSLVNIIQKDKKIINFDAVVFDKRSYLFVYLKNSFSIFPGNSPIKIDVTDPVKPREIPAKNKNNPGTYEKIFEINDKLILGVLNPNINGYLQIFDFTNSRNPIPLYESTDYDKHIHKEVTDIDIFNISNHTLVFPHNNPAEKLYIIDIENPESYITPNWYIQNSSDYINIFDIMTVDWHNGTYVIVFTNTGSLHSINMTIPSRPVLISSIYENTNGFGSLLPVNNVETFHVSDRVFAVFPTRENKNIFNNNAIQIIDITNPTSLTPAGTIPYDTINAIDVVELDGTAYVLISGKEFANYGWEYVNVMKIAGFEDILNHTMSISKLFVDNGETNRIEIECQNAIENYMNGVYLKQLSEEVRFLKTCSLNYPEIFLDHKDMCMQIGNDCKDNKIKTEQDERIAQRCLVHFNTNECSEYLFSRMPNSSNIWIENMNAIRDGDKLVITGTIKNLGTIPVESIVIDKLSIGDFIITQNSQLIDGIPNDDYGNVNITGVLFDKSICTTSNIKMTDKGNEAVETGCVMDTNSLEFYGISISKTKLEKIEGKGSTIFSIILETGGSNKLDVSQSISKSEPLEITFNVFTADTEYKTEMFGVIVR